MEKAVFIGHNALGDTLCTTPVLRAFRGTHPKTFIIYVVQNAPFCRVLDGNPDIDLVLYSEHIHLHGLENLTQEWLQSLPLDLRTPTTLYRFDIRQVCTSAEAFQQHISFGFSRLLGIPIESTRPVVVVTESERRVARSLTSGPYVVLSLHSLANPPRPDGQGEAKAWPLARWLALAHELSVRDGYDIIALGSEHDPRPALNGTRLLYGLPIKVAAALLENAAAVVTLENGLAHLAAAVDAPAVQLYADLVPLPWARPAEATRWKVFYGDPHQVSVESVLEAVREVAAQPRGPW